MEHLKALRKERKLNQTKLAKIVGVAENTFSQYETNKRQMPDQVKKLCADYFNVSIDYLMDRSNDSTPIKSSRISVLGHIAAGIPVEMVEDIVDFEDIPQEWLKGGQKYFGLKIKGNSMYPKYIQNDTIIIRKQETCESGQDAVVAVNGDNATLKTVIKREDGIILQPLNLTEFTPKFYSSKEVNELPIQILGIVVEIRRTI